MLTTPLNSPPDVVFLPCTFPLVGFLDGDHSWALDPWDEDALDSTTAL